MKVFTISEPIFKTATLFIAGCSHHRLTQYLKRRGVNAGLDEGQCGQMFTFTQPPWRVVWVEKYPTGTEHLGN